MERVGFVFRALIVFSFAAFGVEHVVFGDFVTRVAPPLPAWIPWHPLWALLTGLGLIAGAAALACGQRKAAVVMGAAFLLAAVLLHLPMAIQNPSNGGLWTRFGKGMTLAGCAFLVAESLSARGGRVIPEWLLPRGKDLLACFLILCGVEHFLYQEFVASLVPAWIPWHFFWTYFAGVALIAGGIGILLPRTARTALLLSGIMILAWVPLVHIPRALADLRNSNELSSVFEALAFGSAANRVPCRNGRPLYAVLTPVPTEATTRCTEARSCRSRLPDRAAPARALPRQGEIAARSPA